MPTPETAKCFAEGALSSVPTGARAAVREFELVLNRVLRRYSDQVAALRFDRDMVMEELAAAAGQLEILKCRLSVVQAGCRTERARIEEALATAERAQVARGEAMKLAAQGGDGAEDQR